MEPESNPSHCGLETRALPLRNQHPRLDNLWHNRFESEEIFCGRVTSYITYFIYEDWVEPLSAEQ